MGTPGVHPNTSILDGPREQEEKIKFLDRSQEHDDQVHGEDDVISTMSESSSGIGGLDSFLGCKTAERQTPGRKAVRGHESDVDSGIVSCQLMDNHTASISSSETDSSRESSSNEPNSRSISDSIQCVRFDEHLHLSEENIRRSCRKLFATLYSHRFSYPCYNGNVPPKLTNGKQDSCDQKPNGVTASDSCYGKYNFSVRTGITKLDNHHSELQNRQFKTLGNTYSIARLDTVNNRKDPGVCGNVRRLKPTYWNSETNIPRSFPKTLYDIGDYGPTESVPQALQAASGVRMNGIRDSERNLCRNSNGVMKEQTNFRRLSVDQHVPATHMNGPGVRKRSEMVHPLPSLHQQIRHPSNDNNPRHNNSLIHKSLSCTVLSSPNFTTSLIPCDNQGSSPPRRISDPISISSLNISDTYPVPGFQRSPHHITHVPLRNSMIKAYARVVPILSDDPKCNASDEPTVCNGSVRTNSAKMSKDGRSSAPLTNTPSSTSRRSNIKPAVLEINAVESIIAKQESRTPAQTTSNQYYSKISEDFRENCRYQKGRLYAGNRHSAGVYKHPSQTEISNYEYSNSKSNLNEDTKGSSRANVSNYQSLRHLKTNGNHKSPTSTYAMLDESKKNRFNSLPALDNIKSSEKKSTEDPDMNSKRGLHQSDFTLYRNRPSPSASGKSFLNRIQGFTRSAKNAVQKAFSMERIYRPEREERYDSEGQKLKRSHSFIRGLKERMSKKKKREKKRKKLPAAQVAAQERLNTSWDEPVSGTESQITHVEGQLLQLNPDGSQVIELTKPPSKPYGFFVARGRIRNSRGVFVSRMRDHETEEHLAGLLGIGDEILEIEGLNVKHADILQVNSLMSQRNSLILTVLPYVCRQD